MAVAVNAGNPNYDMFLLDHFPEWRAVYFDDTPACLKAVSEGQADCLLIRNYRYNNIAAPSQRYRLVTLSTGVAMDYCFAVKKGDRIDFVCDYYSYDGKYLDSYVFGNGITYTDGLEISYVYLPDTSKANAVYRFTDIYDQNYWTPVMPVTE